MTPQFDHTQHQNMPHFIYYGVTPSLNDYLSATGRNPRAGNNMKQGFVNDLSWCIRKDLKRWKADNPIILHYVIYEPNKKRDHDNTISVIMKYIQDTLQKCGVIPNDGWANVLNFTHDFYLDRENPRVEVYIEEVIENANGSI